MVIGAHAVAVYGHPRATGDLDIWIRPTRENAERVWKRAAGRPQDLADLADLEGTDPTRP